jgi:hypothetical protein
MLTAVVSNLGHAYSGGDSKISYGGGVCKIEKNILFYDKYIILRPTRDPDVRTFD